MDSLANVLQTVRSRNLPFWKLYKGSQKVAQCDADENPEALPEEAITQLEIELENRPSGNYSINVYKRLKGESGGFRYDFSIHQQQLNSRSNMGLTAQEIYQQAERDFKIISALERIEKQNDAIIQAIVTLNDDDDGNDTKVLSLLSSFLGKGMNAQKAVTAARPGAIAANGFNGLKF